MTMGGGGKVGQDEFLDNRVGGAPACFQIHHGILRNIATRFLDVVDDIGFFHHVVVSKGNRFLESICQQFAANVDPIRQYISK